MQRVGRLPTHIPAAARKVYANRGWKGMGDWLGTCAIAPTRRTFRPFTEARAFARQIKLKGKCSALGDCPHTSQQPREKFTRTEGGRAWAIGWGPARSHPPAGRSVRSLKRGHLLEIGRASC